MFNLRKSLEVMYGSCLDNTLWLIPGKAANVYMVADDDNEEGKEEQTAS